MPILDAYSPDPARYDGRMPYRRVGRTGLKLPAISLGLWHNFGDDVPFATQRATLRRAFELGVTHFDLANNYGPPYGAAETNFGRHFREDFKTYRDELIISSKAGWDMWPGPYGDLGSRKYLLASLDQSLARMGWTTSTSSTTTTLMRPRPWKRPWPRSIPQYDKVKRCTWGSRPTPVSGPARRWRWPRKWARPW